MNFDELREKFQSAVETHPDSEEAQARWGKFQYLIGFNLWCFEFNRPPMNDGPLEFQTDEEFFNFLETIPDNIKYETCFLEAKQAFQSAIPVYTEKKNLTEAASLLRSLSLVHDKLNETEERKECMNKALELFSIAENFDGLAMIYSDMAHEAAFVAYDYPAAFDFLEKASANYEKANDKIGVAQCLIHTGDLRDPQRMEGEFGDLKKVEECLIEAKNIFLEQEDPASAIQTLGKLIAIFQENEQIPEQEKHLVEAVDLVVAHMGKEHWSQNYEVLAHYYGERENEEKYNQYMKKALEFDSFRPKQG